MTGVVKTMSTFPSAGRYEVGSDPASISVKTWAPAGSPTAILQLNHGMMEYIDRYDDFARAAADRGCLVVGMDFIGHGDSVSDSQQLGFTGVGLPDGRNVLIEDMHTLRQLTAAARPGLPYVMFAHSMGSFVLRAYLGLHGDGLSGAVISGTGTMSSGLLVSAKAILGLLGLFHKPTYRSPFFAAMSTGPYNKPFPGRTEFDWLSRDDAQVDKYVADPRCGGLFTLAADKVLIDSIGRANAPTTFEATPKGLPLLIMSGEADPVGGMGTGVNSVAQAYRAAGVKEATVRLYPQARHELLSELNRDDVTADLLGWIGDHTG